MRPLLLAVRANKILPVLARLGLENKTLEIPPRFTLRAAILLREDPLSILRSSVKDPRQEIT
jgi:hypothetical protein